MQKKSIKTTRIKGVRVSGLKDIEKVLTELKKEINIIYGRRFLKLILYGSYARGEAGEESDIDVVVVLAGAVSPGREIDRMMNIITDINLRYNVLISVYPTSENSLNNVKSPLLLNVNAEGISI